MHRFGVRFLGQIRIFLFVLIPVTTEGLKSFLLKRDNIILSGSSNDYKQTIIQVRKKQPDILIIDVIDDTCLDTKEFFKFLGNILKCAWKRKIIIYTSSNDQLYLRRLFEAGIKSIVHKINPQNIFFEACEIVNITGRYIDQTITSTLLKQNITSNNNLEYKINKLSHRQKEILGLFRLGMNNKEISDKLFISYRTLEVHKSNIARKLGLNGRRELLKFVVSIPKGVEI